MTPLRLEYPRGRFDCSLCTDGGRGTLVTDLKLFQLDADGRYVELRGSTVALEVELQRRIEAGMEAMLGIRFLASEYPTGPWHRGRIDTLGLDENNTPVVIEYKKGSDSGIMSQAVSYLSWLDSARHEFEAPVKEKLGTEAAETKFVTPFVKDGQTVYLAFQVNKPGKYTYYAEPKAGGDRIEGTIEVS